MTLFILSFPTSTSISHFISILEEKISLIGGGCSIDNQCGIGQQCKNNSCIEVAGIQSRFAGKSQNYIDQNSEKLNIILRSPSRFEFLV